MQSIWHHHSYQLCSPMWRCTVWGGGAVYCRGTLYCLPEKQNAASQETSLKKWGLLIRGKYKLCFCLWSQQLCLPSFWDRCRLLSHSRKGGDCVMCQQIQMERTLMQRLQLNFPRDCTLQKPRARQNETELAQQTVTSHHITSQLEPLMES